MYSPNSSIQQAQLSQSFLADARKLDLASQRPGRAKHYKTVVFHGEATSLRVWELNVYSLSEPCTLIWWLTIGHQVVKRFQEVNTLD